MSDHQGSGPKQHIEHLERELHAAETEMNAKIKMLKWKSKITESMERALRQCTSMSSLLVDAYIQTHTHTHKHIQVHSRNNENKKC